MDKPKPPVYWTDKHRTHDWFGVIVVGRQVIPVMVINVFLLIIAVGLAVYGAIISPKDPTGGWITSPEGFIPLVIFAAVVVGVFALIWLTVAVRTFGRWIVEVMKEAKDGLDKTWRDE